MMNEKYEKVISRLMWKMHRNHNSVLRMFDALSVMAKLDSDLFTASDINASGSTLHELQMYIGDNFKIFEIDHSEPCTITIKKRYWDWKIGVSYEKVTTLEKSRYVYRRLWTPKEIYMIINILSEKMRVIL